MHVPLMNRIVQDFGDLPFTDLRHIFIDKISIFSATFVHGCRIVNEASVQPTPPLNPNCMNENRPFCSA